MYLISNSRRDLSTAEVQVIFVSMRKYFRRDCVYKSVTIAGKSELCSDKYYNFSCIHINLSIT